MRHGLYLSLARIAGISLLAGGAFARTLVVDNRHAAADDANPGTPEAPFLTLNAAAQIAEAGDTVLVRPGLYRESVVIPNSGKEGAPILFKSEERHQAIVSGADLISQWHKVSPGVWYAETPDISYNVHGNGEWVHVNGFPLLRADERERLLPGMFFQDLENGRLYVALDDDIHQEQVEFAWRQGLFSGDPWHFHQQRDREWHTDIHIIGFTLERDGSWVRGKSAIALLGNRWVIEDNHIRWVSTRAIGGRGGDIVIRNNLIEWAGQLAVGGAFVNLLMEGNRILYSNWRRFNPSWEAGATKFVTTLDSVFRDNVFAYAYGPGWWSDGRTSSNLIKKNISHDHIGYLGTGFFTEIDFFGQIFRDNISYNNAHGITVAETSGALVRRNILFNNELGIRMRGHNRRRVGNQQQLREPQEREINLLARLGADPRRIEQWISQHIICWNAPDALMSNNSAIWENLVFDNEVNYFEHRNYGEPSAADPFINNFSDYNIWHADHPAGYFRHERGAYESFERWQEVSGRDAHSVMLNPREAVDQLPAWAQAHREVWRERMRGAEAMRALDLKLLASPQAAVAMARIRRAESVREVELSNRDLRAFIFDHEGERLLAVWNTQTVGRHYVRLDVGRERIVRENAYQHREEVVLPEQAIDLAVSWEPVYLRGVGAEIAEIPSGILRVRGFNAPGETIPAEALFLNPDHTHHESLALRFTASKGFEVRPANVAQLLGPAESTVIPVALVPDGTMLRGTGTLVMEGAIGREEVRRVVSFVVGESAGMIPYVQPGRITTNGRLDDWGEIVSVGPPLGVINTIEQANFITFSQATRRPDGDHSRWKGPEDLSVWLYAAWNEEYFYLAARVVDDVVVPAPEGTAPWSADAVEFFLDGRSPEMQWQVEPTLGCYQIGVSPARGEMPSNVQVFDQGRQMEGLETGTSLTEDGYIVEVRIPLTENNFPAGGWEAGRSIQLGVIANDKDDPEADTRDYAFFWGGGPGRYFMDTTLWTTLTLGEKE